MSVSVTGLLETIARLAAMSAEAEAKATEAVQGATQDALDASLPMIPVLTGLLKSGQQMRMVSGGMLVEGELFNDTPYARWVCFGHHTESGSWVPPQDFMTGPILIGQQSLVRRLGEMVLV